MKKIIMVVGLLLGLTVLGSRTARAQVPDDIRIVALGGSRQVEVLPHGSPTWVLTQTNQTLHPLDRIRVGRDSSAAIAFTGKNAVRFDALTEIEILPSTADDDHSLNLMRGILSFFHRDQPGRIRIISSGGTAGIKGTEFVMSVLPVNGVEQTTISVVDGDVHLANSAGELELTNGQQAVAAPGSAPTRTSGFIANNVLQWCFYYPGVLDLNDLGLGEKDFSGESAAAYRAGNPSAALAKFQGNMSVISDEQSLYHATLLLNNAQIADAEKTLAQFSPASEKNQRLASALRMLIAAVRHETFNSSFKPQLATEFLAASYYAQSQPGPKSLDTSLALARQSVAASPQFGFGWERVAELEFGFGRTDRAQAALDRALKFSPHNAQALALKGFLLAAKNKTREAVAQFDRALAADSTLGNAWLGRGLCRIRSGDLKGGHEDLLIAAAMEPGRAALRSYLGKSFGDAGGTTNTALARHELALAKNLDPHDPTAWLYSALLNEQNNRVNEAVRDLEKSQELNNNRAVYRAPVLLDQDRAVRSANLARIYDEAGLGDVALREASRAVAADYANFSSHLFLANSYAQLRQANAFDQRFETPAFSEYLLASLLGPADGRMLAQPVTQQEYTHLLDRDSFGFSSDTSYTSRGAVSQYAAQYGTFGNSSYAVESSYDWNPGQTRNGSEETHQFSLKWKQMLTPKDGLFFEILDFHQDAGDVSQRYNPAQANLTVKSWEKQEPSFIVGLDHKWTESQHTLLLVSRFNDSIRQTNHVAPVFLLTEVFGSPDGFFSKDLSQQFAKRQTVDSFELQHLMTLSSFQFIAGARLQNINNKIRNTQTLLPDNSPFYQSYFADFAPALVAQQWAEQHAFEASPYVYGYWQATSELTLMGGASFDYLDQPRNSLFAPLAAGQETKRQISPKFALVWHPAPRATLRAAYSRSLGGYDLDQSVRLEPTQMAGFVTTYRNLFPSSIAGSVSGAEFETVDGSLEYNFEHDTYAALSLQLLRSHDTHDVGLFSRDLFPAGPPDVLQTPERLQFQERSLGFSLEHLFGKFLSAGLQYQVSDAWYSQTYPQMARLAAANPAMAPSLAATSATDRGILQTIRLGLTYQHPGGFFAGAESVWRGQLLRNDLAGLPGDDFWQENLVAGYRFPRRHAELRVALLNVTDQNYRLHPINLYPDIARGRTLAMELKINF